MEHWDTTTRLFDTSGGGTPPDSLCIVPIKNFTKIIDSDDIPEVDTETNPDEQETEAA